MRLSRFSGLASQSVVLGHVVFDFPRTRAAYRVGSSSNRASCRAYAASRSSTGTTTERIVAARSASSSSPLRSAPTATPAAATTANRVGSGTTCPALASQGQPAIDLHRLFERA